MIRNCKGLEACPPSFFYNIEVDFEDKSLLSSLWQREELPLFGKEGRGEIFIPIKSGSIMDSLVIFIPGPEPLRHVLSGLPIRTGFTPLEIMDRPSRASGSNDWDF
jgi:hypothetical protein